MLLFSLFLLLLIFFFISQWRDERERGRRFTYVKCNFSIKRHLNLPRQDEIRRMKMVRGDSKDAWCKIHANGKWEKKKEGRQRCRDARVVV